MTFRRSLWIVLLGLGVVAEAVLPAGLGAQVPVRRDTLSGRRDTVRSRVDTAGGRRNPPPAGRDTVNIPLPLRPADTLSKSDTTKKGLVPLPVDTAVKRDTIKPPLARAEAPPIIEIGPQRVYDRTALYATGAQTLSELLGRVPGITEFAAGGMGSPVVLASQGDLRRIRLFIDGLELDPMDRRARGVAPINDLPLHALEEVRIERGAEEVRVYARTWRVDRTVPYTRADIATGDQNSNQYRAFFGKRYDHGESFQVSAEQFTTQPDNSLPSSDALNLMGRLGITRGPWSADGFIERSHKNRAPWRGTGDDEERAQVIDGIETTRSTAYVRLGNGDPDRGRWMQVMASAEEYHGKPRSSTSVGADTSATSVGDSVAYESQYLMTGGFTRGPFQLSGVERVRVGGTRTSHVMSGRASAVGGPIALSLFAEGQSYINPSRYEGTAKFSLGDRIAVTGSASRTGSGTFDRLFVEPRSAVVFTDTGSFDLSGLGPFVKADTSEVTRYQLAARNNLRAEAGIRVRDLWISGGIMRRGATTLLAPAEFDTAYQKAPAIRREPEATARTASIRGRLWKAVYADVWGVAWSDSGYYRPQYQTRSELYIQTNLLDKFPRGNFGILTSLAHEYRSSARFPVNADSVAVAPGFRTISFRLEIRIATAVVSYQFRNLLQEKYAMVPGFNMPRQTQFYGVRWDFWN
ncbi:MAG: Plug domain-containing protein [Gemmatimonadaceae bacterium]